MNTMLGIFGLGGGEVIVILVVFLVMFGAKKLPELAKGLGTGIKEFKKATSEVTEEVQKAMEAPPTPPVKRLPEATTVATEQHSMSQPASPAHKA